MTDKIIIADHPLASLASSDLPIRRALIYARVSSNSQFVQGVSLDVQVEKCLQWCDRNNIVVLDVVREVQSMRKAEQQGHWTRSIERILGGQGEEQQPLVGVTYFVFYNLSRVSRNVVMGTKLVDSLLARGVRPISVQDPALDFATQDGRMVMHNLLTASEHEGNQIAKRVTDTFAHLREIGHHWGTVPYGSSVLESQLKEEVSGLERMKTLRKLVPNKQEERVLRWVLGLREAAHSRKPQLLACFRRMPECTPGRERWMRDVLDNSYALTFATIADILNEARIPYKKGPWTPASVNSCCERFKASSGFTGRTVPLR